MGLLSVRTSAVKPAKPLRLAIVIRYFSKKDPIQRFCLRSRTRKATSAKLVRGSVLELRGRWVHEFGDTRSNVSAHFASNPGSAFTVSDEGISRDNAVLGVGLATKLNTKTGVFIDYDVSLSSNNISHIVCLCLVHRWS